MRAIVATGVQTFEVMDLSPVEIGERDVVVAIDASAMCASEVHCLDVDLGLPGYPWVLGHSGTGIVQEVGAGVSRIRLGDRVIVTATFQCGECYFCRHGSPDACDDVYGQAHRRVATDHGGRAVGGMVGIGSHADVMVYPESNLVPVESDIDPTYLSMLGCGIVSGVGAVRELAQVVPGESVAISGCGPLGLWMVQGALVSGAETIVAVDPDPARRRQALELGATLALEPGDTLVEEIRSLTGGRGVDVGLEAAGSTEAMETAFALTRPGGRVVPTGLVADPAAVVRLPAFDYAIGSRQILSAQAGGGDIRAMIPAYVELMNSGRLDYRPFLSRLFGFDEAKAALDAVRERSLITGVIVPDRA